jgi:hypothetical protein
MDRGICLITMTAHIISKTALKVLVIGPVYDKTEKLLRAGTLVPEYDYVIFNGGLCYPNHNILEVQQRLEQMDVLIKTGKVIYNLDSHDLLFAESLDADKRESRILKWIWSKPNVVIIYFKNAQSTTIITGGGVTPQMNREVLLDNMETSFVSKIQGVSWHKIYGGMQGYIISNNPLTFQKPQFHNFSAQIGNDYGPETQVYAQEVDGFGLKRTILL